MNERLKELLMRSSGRSRLLAVIATCSVLLFSACNELQFTLTFTNADNLQSGDPVVYKGIQIGKVVSVDLAGNVPRVKVRIDNDHRRVVYREAVFVIESSAGDSHRQVTVTAPLIGSARSPIEKNEIIEGSGPIAKLLP
jgi:hypothetical protein